LVIDPELSFAKKIGQRLPKFWSSILNFHSPKNWSEITKILVIDPELSFAKILVIDPELSFAKKLVRDYQNFGPDYGIHAFVYIYTNEHYTNVV
jgi:hypothetical protein